MAGFNAFMPAADAYAAYARVDAHARHLAAQPGEDRTLAQLRADVLADLLANGETALSGPRAGRPSVAITIPVMTMLGHDDAPAILDGYGPIDLDTARRLAGEAIQLDPDPHPPGHRHRARRGPHDLPRAEGAAAVAGRPRSGVRRSRAAPASPVIATSITASTGNTAERPRPKTPRRSASHIMSSRRRASGCCIATRSPARPGGSPPPHSGSTSTRHPSKSRPATF